MKRILFHALLTFLLLLGACASKKTSNDEFNQAVLDRARNILDAPANTAPQAHSGWPEVGGFQLRLSGVAATNASPELWALYTIRFVGKQQDAARCLKYIQSEIPAVRNTAEKSFVLLAQPEKSQILLGLLESTDDKLRKLALAYSGWQNSGLSDDDLRNLIKSSDEAVRAMAQQVLANKVAGPQK